MTETIEQKALVERLREKIVDTLLAGLPYNRDGDEAAYRIEDLEAENERLREALEWYVAEDAKYMRAALGEKQ